VLDFGLEFGLLRLDFLEFFAGELDEVLVAVRLKGLSEEALLRFLDGKPETVEIVLTGRFATPALVRRADLVTEMKERKHYSAQGVRAREGIEK
ncbi:hypothetical protein D4R89_08890, partial [bacterium]